MIDSIALASRHAANQKARLPSNEGLKIDVRSDLRTYRKQSLPLRHVNQTKENNNITLFDVIRAFVAARFPYETAVE